MFSLETMGYFSDAPGSQQYPAPLSSLLARVVVGLEATFAELAAP